MNQIVTYLTEARNELMKVTWPTRAQATKLTIAVIIFSLVFAALIGGLDFLFSQALQRLILKV